MRFAHLNQSQIAGRHFPLFLGVIHLSSISLEGKNKSHRQTGTTEFHIRDASEHGQQWQELPPGSLTLVCPHLPLLDSGVLFFPLRIRPAISADTEPVCHQQQPRLPPLRCIHLLVTLHSLQLTAAACRNATLFLQAEISSIYLVSRAADSVVVRLLCMRMGVQVNPWRQLNHLSWRAGKDL